MQPDHCPLASAEPETGIALSVMMSTDECSSTCTNRLQTKTEQCRSQNRKTIAQKKFHLPVNNLNGIVNTD